MKIDLKAIAILAASAGLVFFFLTRKGGAAPSFNNVVSGSSVLSELRTQQEIAYAESLGDFAG